MLTEEVCEDAMDFFFVFGDSINNIEIYGLIANWFSYLSMLECVSNILKVMKQ